MTRMMRIAVAVTVTAIGHNVAAETPTQRAAAGLDTIVVTATRVPVRAGEAPAVVEVQTREDLRHERQARTTPEALHRVPGVMVQKTAHGQGSPYIRGFTGFRTLLMIDNVRVNNSTFRDGPNQYWNTVDPFSIGRLELVKGPASVLYGSDAVGGAANALTPDPAELSDGDLQTRLLYRYASAGDTHIARAEAARAGAGGWGFVAGMSVKEFGDLRSAAGRQLHTGYSERDFDGKLTYDTAQGRLTLVHQRVATDDAWRTHRTVYSQPIHGTAIGNEKRRSLNQRRDLTYLRYETGFDTGPLHRVAVTASHQRQGEDRLRVRADDRRDHQGVEVDTLGLALDTTLGPGGKWQAGVEYYLDGVDSFRRDFKADGSLRAQRLQGPVGDDARYESGGLYLQHRSQLGAVGLTWGARYNFASARARNVQDPVSGDRIEIRDSWDALVGSLRALLPLGQSGWSLFGGVAQGFRAPNLSDLTRLDSARSDEIEVPSPDLQPEHFVSYELGARASRNRWHLELAAFHTDIDELIIRTPSGRSIEGDSEVVKVNSGHGRIRGFELQGGYRPLRAIELYASLSWLDGELLTFPTAAPVGRLEPIDRLMPTTAVAGLRLRPADARHWLGLDVVHAGDADRLSSRDAADRQRIPPGGTRGYTVVHLRGGYALSRQLEVSVAIENLTDRLYRVHGSGVNEAGRNLLLTLDYLPGG